jgi:hypothetical protein
MTGSNMKKFVAHYLVPASVTADPSDRIRRSAVANRAASGGTRLMEDVLERVAARGNNITIGPSLLGSIADRAWDAKRRHLAVLRDAHGAGKRDDTDNSSE